MASMSCLWLITLAVRNRPEGRDEMDGDITEMGLEELGESVHLSVGSYNYADYCERIK